MIPKNIFITHKRTPKNYLETIKSLNSDFNVYYFDDEAVQKLLESHFSKQVNQAYNRLIPGAYKADLFRYCVLYLFGGVYTDVGIPYEVGFNHLWDLSSDKVLLTRDVHPATIQIATMAAPKNSKFLKLCITTAVNNVLNDFYGKTPMCITGPHMAWQCFVEYTGQKQTELAEYPSINRDDIPIQIDYKLVHTPDHIRENVVEAVYVDKYNQYVCAYKPNSERGHRANSDYYTNAWLERRVYVN